MVAAGHKDGGTTVVFQGKERGKTTIIEGGKMMNVMIMTSFKLIYSSLTFIGEVSDSIQKESNKWCSATCLLFYQAVRGHSKETEEDNYDDAL
jgi:hypothetical protein